MSTGFLATLWGLATIGAVVCCGSAEAYSDRLPQVQRSMATHACIDGGWRAATCSSELLRSIGENDIRTASNTTQAK